MWMEPLSRLFVSLALLGQTAATAPPAAPEPIATRQSVFAIPFRVDRIDDPTHQPVELQLYVSTDRGTRWQLYSKVPPSQQHFLFRAGGDGEYWFAIRTVDGSGRVRPETIGSPGLRVLIDTVAPVLKLTAQRSPAGPVTVRWEINKPNIKPGSLNIQYRASAAESWQPAPIERQGHKNPGTPQAGQLAFWPKPEAGTIQIRAEVSDTAGNSTTTQTELKMENPRRDAGPPITAEKNAGPSIAAEPTGSVAIAINPAVGNKFSASGKTMGKPSAESPTFPNMPPGERPRMVNSRLFELEYDVDSVGPSGIGKVELWGTRDGGKTWRRFAHDNNRSPLLVNVEEEGIYGFRIIVSNGAGVGGKPPAAGDLPDLWVGVDLTKPTARLVSAQQGVDAEAGALIISWQADDKMLAARPVSLSFRQSRSEPWLPIANGLENTGRYAWPINNRTPSQFYLRLEVRDEAGNVGVHEMPEPVTVDQSSPTIRVRDIHAVGQAGLEPVR